MEAYVTTCCNAGCGFRRTWIGYKTGLGKTPVQLAKMAEDMRVCIKCKGPADTTLDDRGLAGAIDAQMKALRFLGD